MLVLNNIVVKYNDDRIVNSYPTPVKFIPRPEWKIDNDLPLEIKLVVEFKLKITLFDDEYEYKLIDATTKDENSYLVYFPIRLRGLYNETEETYKHLNYEIESVSMFAPNAGRNIIDRHDHVVAWLMSDAVSFEFFPEKCQQIQQIQELPISTKREVHSRKDCTSKGRSFQIKRSETSDIPETLNYGELAYSFKSKTLYIGDENEKPIAIVKNS